MRGGDIPDQPLADELGLAVGRLGFAWRVLGDQRHVGRAVDRRRGGEDQPPHSGLDDGREQGAQAVDVLLVVPERFLDRLADLLLRRDVHDAADLVLGEHAVNSRAVSHRADLQRNAVGHSALVSGGQVVEDDHAGTVGEQCPHHMRTDESGASGYQPCHALDPIRAAATIRR